MLRGQDRADGRRDRRDIWGELSSGHRYLDFLFFFFGAESVDDEVGKQTNKITSHKKDGRFKNQAQNELLTERNISKSSILKILDFF